MILLALDTSKKSLTVSLTVDGVQHGAYFADCGVTHSEVLLPHIQRIMDEAGVTVSQLDGVGCVVGPGSFTGIRIGVTTVRAIAQVQNIPCVAVTSTELMAYLERETCITATDAAQKKVYYQAFECGKPLTEPSVCEAKDFDALPYGGKVITDMPSLVTQRPCVQFDSSLEALGGIVSDRFSGGKTVDYNGLVPLYVRECQAVESLKAKK